MDGKTQRYNEITFEAFCKTVIHNAVVNAKKERANRAKMEIPFSSLPEPFVLSWGANDAALDDIEERLEPTKFYGRKHEIGVYNAKLARVLQALPPKERAVILLYYILRMKYHEIAEVLGISTSAAHRRRVAAESKIRLLMEDEE